MNAGKVKTFRHLGLHDTLYRNKALGRKFLEKVSNEWSTLGTKSRSPYGNSFFGQSLYHIQLLKNAYGIKKRSFLKQLIFKSKNRRGTKSRNLLNLLENKLDYFLFNSGYVKTLTRAKELLESGQIKVNGELVRTGGYILKSTDKIALRRDDPKLVGETKYNVVSGFSMTTQWSFYKELLEDTMLIDTTRRKFSSFSLEKNISGAAAPEYLNHSNCFLKNLVSRNLGTLGLTKTELFEFSKDLSVEKKQHVGIYIDGSRISKKYLNQTSSFLKSERGTLENKNTRMQKYLSENYLAAMSSEGMERYVTASLLFNDLSLLNPVWEDCVDQTTSDVATEIQVHSAPQGTALVDTEGLYTNPHFSNSVNSTEMLVTEEPEESSSELEFTIPHDEELDLTEELEEIREGADYYSQLEIDVVESRAPYMESYNNVRNLYCQSIQSIFLDSRQVLEGDQNYNSICKNCSCDMENHVITDGSILTEETPEFGSLSASELATISEYYANLVFSENAELLENALLSLDSMAQSVVLRDKKEGARFNLVARSPEVTGESFYLDPELWELRSRISEEFSESKINSSEYVIKATR